MAGLKKKNVHGIPYLKVIQQYFDISNYGKDFKSDSSHKNDQIGFCVSITLRRHILTSDIYDKNNMHENQQERRSWENLMKL